jgi:hypothetical protein
VKGFGRLVLGVALLCCTSASAADQGEVVFDFYAWSRVAAGGPETKIRFGGGLSVDSPLAIGDDRTFGDIGLSLDIESLPDKGEFSFADLGTWGDYFELSGFLSRQFGSAEVSNGTIRTSVVVFGGATFESLGAQPEGTPEARRALRHYAAGLLLEHRRTDGARSWIRVGYGTDDAVGPPAWRQVLARWSVALKGPLYMDGRAGLAFGEASLSGLQPDYITAGLRLAVDELIAK